MNKEISIENIKLNLNLPDFKTTEDIIPFKGIIGQETAKKFIEMGLEINKKEYNIYISGHRGTGKTTYILEKIENYAKTLSTPNDWCYAYNFKDENNPVALSLPPNKGTEFKKDITNLLKFIIEEAPIHFTSNTYEKKRNTIINKYEEQIIGLNDELNALALEKNLIIEEDSSEGIVFIPMLNDKEMDSEEYNKLPQAKKDLINKNASDLRLVSIEILKETKILEKKMDEELCKLENKIANKLLTKKIKLLLDKYNFSEKINNYIINLKEDLISNINYFLGDIDSNLNNKEKNLKNTKLFEGFLDDPIYRRYSINVIVSNKENSGAPVIFQDSSEYYDLFGQIDYENSMGNLITDFTHIRSGNIHKANGGFLILNANDFITNMDIYENLKRCLKTKEITIENVKNSIELLPIASLKPESIPINLKIILIGSDLIYSLLLAHDPDFQRFFKVKAEFDSNIKLNEKNLNEVIGYMTNYINNKKFLHIEKAGIKELLLYSCRLSENKFYFSSSIGKLLDIIDISNYLAKKENCTYIKKVHVLRALHDEQEMHSLIKYKILEMYKKNQYLIDINGSKIGQINGLSVCDFGDISLGMVHKITVTTYAGRKGIVNIERESKMSGNIHNKSVMILSGFIGNLLGQETYLSFNASIVFEQLYSGIEGDSASCAELVALLSSLADIPIKQNLAITGSINQYGQIQPIGGVNEKIEGFFDTCNLFGLNGMQGVIIPKGNLENLVLKNEVLDAIEKNLFHIYSIENIEDCLKLLYELKLDASDNTLNTVKNKILLKLKDFNRLLKNDI